jgi:3-hydroxyisobutyrate dehydrogenase
MINQLLCGVHIAAMGVAMVLAIRAGVDAKTIYEVISNSAGSSWMFRNRDPHIVDNDYSPLSAVDILVKDLGIVLETGMALTFPLPIAASAHRMFLAASSAGYGREDDAAVVKVYRDLTGIKLPGDEQA